MPRANDLREFLLRLLLKCSQYAISAALLLYVVLSWSPSLAASRQSDAVVGPPDYWTETDGADINTASIDMDFGPGTHLVYSNRSVNQILTPNAADTRRVRVWDLIQWA